MYHELIPVRGTPKLFLLDALGEYFDNSSVHDFCRLLKSTGSWILGSFALMAVTESTRWKAGDVDIFVDHASPKSVAAIAMLTSFLVQKGFKLDMGDSRYGTFFEVLTFTSRSRLSSTLKIQIIADKMTTEYSFPLRTLKQFDLSCCCCAFNGASLYKAAWNLLPNFFCQHVGVNTPLRIEKYCSRGLTFQYFAPTCSVVVRRTRATEYRCNREFVDCRCPVHGSDGGLFF